MIIGNRANENIKPHGTNSSGHLNIDNGVNMGLNVFVCSINYDHEHFQF